jgi:hypothetical protein
MTAARLSLSVLAGIAFPALLQAQRVAGTVTDSATGRPLQGVRVEAKAIRDSAIVGSAVTDSTGDFSFVPSRADSLFLSVRRIGYRPITARPFRPGDADHSFRFDLAQLPILLDTVRTEGTKELKKWFFYKLTAGQEWYARHYREARGFFTSGPEILKSGLDACDYLVRVADFQIADSRATGGGGLRCTAGRQTRWAIPNNSGRCVEAYVDRKYPLLYMERFAAVSKPLGFTKTKQLMLTGIRGIEVFMEFHDRPKDFSYIRPKMSIDAEARLNKCALVLLWTQEYWGE